MTEEQDPCGTAVPPCHIRVDKEGVWYYKGAEMFRREIVDLFYDHLLFDEALGKYVIELGKDRCYIEVDDTPYVVRSVYRNGSRDEGDEFLEVLLNTRKCEALDPSSLRTGDENVLYCTVREGRFPARFSRPAYYQIAQWIEHDEDRDAYFISLNGKSHYLP